MPSIVRLLTAAVAGVAVLWLLATGVGAQPGAPGYPLTVTAQAGGSNPTATPTGTAPAATATGTVTSSAAAANASVILGGRGRVANVRPNSFTVSWTTDVDVVGQVRYGPNAALGATAVDARGPAVSGRTHYVEVLGLTANTTYFFDVVSGGQVDNNAGQHYQVKTAPDLTGSPPSSNTLVGRVLQPGGVAPSTGALVWAATRDGNGQGSTGTSQLLAALSGADGRFSLLLQPRTADLAGYFVYSNEGDAVEIAARGAEGAVDLAVNTAVTQGGTHTSDVVLVLGQVTPVPTATATPVPATPRAASPSPAATPAAVSTQAPAPTQAPAAAAAATPTRTAAATVVLAPVQLPTLKEMLLNQGYPAPAAQPPGTAPTPVPAAPGAYPGPAGVTRPPTQPGAAPASPTPLPPPSSKPAPAVDQAPAVNQAPVNPAPAVTAPPVNPVPAVGAPPNQVVPGVVPTAAVPPPQVGPAGVKGPGAGAFNSGQPPSGPRDSFAQPGVAVAPAGPLATLASLPPIVSALFYGGIAAVAVGAGLAIWSVLRGHGWRPR